MHGGIDTDRRLFTLLTMTIHREEILACACDLYLTRGLEGFSMRRLAKAVGVTAPAIYRHFDGKEEVLLAVVGEAYKVFYDYLHRALQGATPSERLRMAGEAYVDFALDHPRYYEMMHAPLAAMGIEKVPEQLRAEACAIGQFWDDRLRECAGVGVVRSSDHESIGLTMWAHAHGFVSLYLRGMMGKIDEAAFRELYRTSVALLLEGVSEESRADLFDDARAPAGESTEAVS